MSVQEPQLLSRDDLLADIPRRYKVVGPLPIRGGYVRIRSLTEAEASAYEAISYADGKLVQARAQDANRRYISLCLVDQAGNRLLGPADIGKLAAWDWADMVFLYTACRDHVNATRPPLETVEKNSEGTPGDA